MSENCSNDCSSCSESCEDRQEEQVDFSAKLNSASSVGKVYAVMSGKGGVGKSMVTSMLAVTMARRGHKTAILDADITGPSIPTVFGITGGVDQSEFGLIPAKSTTGIDIMSLNLLLENATDPVVWRGPIIAGTVKQFWSDVIWNDIDYMFVDMPPGTGDVPLTVFQSLPVDGIIIVTSPQELVSMIVSKAVNMAKMMKVPIVGIVENMSYFKCDNWEKEHKIFGESNIIEIAKNHVIGTIARLPLDPKFAKACDAGLIELTDDNDLSIIVDSIENNGGK